MSAEDDGGAPRPAAGWARTLVVVAAVLAVLLVGAAAGLLIAQTRPAEPAAPAADSVAVGFCQDMSVHHRQAVLMAGIARERSTDQAVRSVAFDIETNQLEQVGRMQGWLNLWGRDPLPIGGYMGWMAAADHGHDGAATTGATSSAGGGKVPRMPGMADDAELRQLRQLGGREFDVLFLQLMLRHHQGGGSMLRHASEHAEAGVVRNLAAQMLTAQTSEADVLTTMLGQRGGSPLPAPN